MDNNLLLSVIKRGFVLQFSFDELINVLEITISKPENTYYVRSCAIFLDLFYRDKDEFDKELSYEIHKLMDNYEREFNKDMLLNRYRYISEDID